MSDLELDIRKGIIAGWDRHISERLVAMDTMIEEVLKLIQSRLEKVEVELAEAKVKIEKLRWSKIYHASGRCRLCGGKENEHQMRCRHYVGPLEHHMVFRNINGTFGGIDYDCICGGWFRRGGLAGHGDGTLDAEVVCPNAADTRRGPKPEEAS